MDGKKTKKQKKNVNKNPTDATVCSTATSPQRGLQATLGGSSCTCTGGCGYSF